MAKKSSKSGGLNLKSDMKLGKLAGKGKSPSKKNL